MTLSKLGADYLHFGLVWVQNPDSGGAWPAFALRKEERRDFVAQCLKWRASIQDLMLLSPLRCDVLFSCTWFKKRHELCTILSNRTLSDTLIFSQPAYQQAHVKFLSKVDKEKMELLEEKMELLEKVNKEKIELIKEIRTVERKLGQELQNSQRKLFEMKQEASKQLRG
jgi:hypothetical protein